MLVASLEQVFIFVDPSTDRDWLLAGYFREIAEIFSICDAAACIDEAVHFHDRFCSDFRESVFLKKCFCVFIRYANVSDRPAKFVCERVGYFVVRNAATNDRVCSTYVPLG